MTRRAPRLAAALTGPAFTALFVTMAALPPRPRFLWNASASAPIGLYAIDPLATVNAPGLVAIEPAEPLATFLASREYLPKGVPLLKHVAAVAGQCVCRVGLTISIDDAPVGDALARDRAGRRLPVWQGCRRIPAGQVFLMNRTVRDSFDGRYFGLVSTSQIIGRARPLWTAAHDDAPSDRRKPAR